MPLTNTEEVLTTKVLVAEAPLDRKKIALTLLERDSIPAIQRYHMMKVAVQEDNTEYILNNPLDLTNTGWTVVTNTGINDAPTDGNTYGRKDGAWSTVGAGGADTQVQFNDGGAFGGDINFTFDKAANILSLGGTAAMKIPVGSNAQRPTGVEGLIRLSNDDLEFEGYKNGKWVHLGWGTEEGTTDVVSPSIQVINETVDDNQINISAGFLTGLSVSNTSIANAATVSLLGIKSTFAEFYSLRLDPDDTEGEGVFTFDQGSSTEAHGLQYIGDISATFLDNSLVNKKWVEDNFSNVAGADTQIQFNDAGVQGAKVGFTYTKSKDMLIAGAGSLAPDFGVGAHAQAGSWSGIFGEEHDFKGTGAGGGRPVNILVSGWHHSIGDTTIGGTFSGAGSAVFGTDHEVYGQQATAMGFGAAAHGMGSFVVSHHDTNGGGLVIRERVLASGSGSTNISANNANQTAGHGALAEASAILGGWNHNIPADSPRSVVFGGDRIKASAATPDTVFMPKLRIGQGVGGALATSGASHGLGYNNTTGEVIRTALTPTPAGATTELQFNLAGVLAASSNLTFASDVLATKKNFSTLYSAIVADTDYGILIQNLNNTTGTFADIHLKAGSTNAANAHISVERTGANNPFLHVMLESLKVMTLESDGQVDFFGDTVVIGDDSTAHDVGIALNDNEEGWVLQYETSTGNFYILSGNGGGPPIYFNELSVFMPALPTVDPSNTGQIWADSGFLKVSA